MHVSRAVCFGIALALACTVAVSGNNHSQDHAKEEGIGDPPRRNRMDFFDGVEWSTRSVIAVFTTFVVSALANAGGLGGGGFLVPLFNLVLGVSLKHAMGLSQAAITGGALAAGALSFFSSHPDDSSRPLLDMNMTLMFMPCLLVGVTLGVTLNEICPDWTLVILISVLLIVLSVRSLKTGLKLHRAEVAQRASHAHDSPQELLTPTTSEIPSMIQIPSRPLSRRHTLSLDMDHARTQPCTLPSAHIHHNSLPNAYLNGLDGSFRIRQNPHANQLSEQAEKQTEEVIPERSRVDWERFSSTVDYKPSTRERQESPFTKTPRQTSAIDDDRGGGVCQQGVKFTLCVLIWAVFLALQIFKSHQFKCSGPYFALYGTQLGFGIICSLGGICIWWWFHQDAIQSDIEQQPLVSSSGVDEEQPPQLSVKRIIVAALCICLGACLASLCGLGGGMVLGPVLLDLGLHPLAAASTSLLLVGASSSTATVQFALGDRLEYGWGSIMFCVCIVASLVGVAGFGKIVRKSGRASLIVFLLFFLMAGGGVLTLGFGIVHTIDSIQHGGRIGFVNLCNL